MLEEIFCPVHDFCREFVPKYKRSLLHSGQNIRQKKRALCISETITILIYFHISGYRKFKHFYLIEVLRGSLRSAFPSAPSYTQFLSFIPHAFPVLSALLHHLKKKPSQGVHYIDSSAIPVCKNKRISRNRVFRGLAQIGKTTMGWFYGFKLHLICDSEGNLCDYMITSGNIGDRKYTEKMSNNARGKLYADKGYISKKLLRLLYEKGLHLVTGIRSNMKHSLLTLKDKILLRKRTLIETIFGKLKEVFQMQHTRHRSPINGFANICCALLAYIFSPNKPKIKSHKDNMHALDQKA